MLTAFDNAANYSAVSRATLPKENIPMPRSLWIVVLVSSLVIIATGCAGGSGQTMVPTPTPTPDSSQYVSVAFAAPAPIAVAEKIGSGNWTTASLPANGPLVVQLPSGTTNYGVAFSCSSVRSGTQVKEEFVIEADVKDGSSYILQLCLSDTPVPPATGSFTGSFDATGVAGAGAVNVNLNDDSRAALFFNTTISSFNITAIAGTTDAFTTVSDSAGTILAMKVLRSQTVPGVANGGSPITVGASDAVTLQPITLANVSPSFTLVVMVPFPSFVTANGSSPVGTKGFPVATEYAVLPAAATQSGDYYSFNVEAGVGNQNVLTKQFQRTTGPVTLTLPDPWAATPPTPATFPTFTFNYTGLASQPAIADNASLGWTQGTTAFGITVVATANSQRGATTVTIPDLTTLPGFFSMAPSGTAITWAATTWGGTTQFYPATLAVPQTISNASDQGTYTQP
jgi:hypothetical protein